MGALAFVTGPVHLDEDGEDLRADLGAALSEALGVQILVTAERSYAALRQRVISGEAALAWLPPVLYVRAHEVGAIAAVMRAERFAGASYQGAIFVRDDSRVRRAEDLRGVRVAWVDRDSCAGYLFPRLAVRAAGLDPDACFRSETFADSHARVVAAVASGGVEAGATYVQAQDPAHPEKGLALAGWTAFAEASSMRAVVVSASIPSDTVCIGASVPEATRARWVERLSQAHALPRVSRLLRAMLGADRLTPGTPEDYRPVRAALVAEGALR
jgi:phosphonate transport system substrate-binding protein